MSAIDWRNATPISGGPLGNYVTPVKDQGNCNSSVSHGILAAVEPMIAISNENPALASGPNSVNLSERALQFCGGGSCGGWNPSSAFDYLRTTGVPDEACSPYYDPTGAILASCFLCADSNERVVKTDLSLQQATIAGILERKYYLQNYGPLAGAMYVHQNFLVYNGGVHQSTGTPTSTMAHVICVIGYDDSQGCWICKNSWGTGWGESGFFRIAYNDPSGIDSFFPFWFTGEPIHNYGSAYINLGEYFDLDDGSWSLPSNNLAQDIQFDIDWATGNFQILSANGTPPCDVLLYNLGPVNYYGLTLQQLKTQPYANTPITVNVGDVIAVRTTKGKYCKALVVNVDWTLLNIDFKTYYTPPYPSSCP